MSNKATNCSTFACVGVDATQAMIKQQVKNGGWGVIDVVRDGKKPPFSYTIGLHYHGLPELISIGLPGNHAHTILNKIAEAMIDNKKPYASGSIIEKVANLPLAVVDATCEKKERTPQAYNHYKHWDYSLAQIVMPDRFGKFPWDDDFETVYMSKCQNLLFDVAIIKNTTSLLSHLPSVFRKL